MCRRTVRTADIDHLQDMYNVFVPHVAAVDPSFDDFVNATSPISVTNGNLKLTEVAFSDSIRPPSDRNPSVLRTGCYPDKAVTASELLLACNERN